MDKHFKDIITTTLIICNYTLAMILLGIMYAKTFGAEGLTPDTALVLLLTNIGMVITMFRLRKRWGLG